MNLNLRLINYINRYAPSYTRLSEYLLKKNCQNFVEVIEWSGYNESLMCDMWMRSFLSMWKGKKEIILKLSKKAFPKEMILQKIEMSSDDIYNWDNYSNHISHQIQSLTSRWKSTRVISNLLIQKYPYFKENIANLFVDTSDLINLEKEVQKYRNRYNIQDKKQQEKMIASLLRKWFHYSDIKNFIIK